MVVDRVDEVDTDQDEGDDGDQLDEHHDVVGAGRLADAAHEDDREQDDDEERGDVEAEMPAGTVDDGAVERVLSTRQQSG